MSDPVRADQTIWLGDVGASVIWAFGPADAPAALTGSQFTLRVRFRGGEIEATSETGGLTMNLQAASVSWTPPPSLVLPRGYGSGYELRRRIAGTDEVWAFGDIIAKSGFRA